jgi:membrane-associated phospholipid phosphatase
MAAIFAFSIRELRWARWAAAVYVPVICFSAIYLQHHYVIDVLVGLSFGAIVAVAMLVWERRRTASTT